MSSEQTDSLKIVDAHHHLWDLKGPISYPWLVHPEPREFEYSTFCRDYLPDEYRRDSALHRVVATVHVEAEGDRKDQVNETGWLHDINAKYGMPNAVVAHAWIDTDDAEEVISRQSRFPLVRGIRTKPVASASPQQSVQGQRRTLGDDRWIRGLALLEKYDLSWDLRVPWWHLAEAAGVVRQYPRLRVALNHAGLPWDRSEQGLAEWRRGMEALADNPNVFCKISFLLVPGKPWTLESNKPIILDAIAIFGVERCMFASNFPVDSMKGSWDYIYRCYKASVAHLEPWQQRRLFADNAIDFYRISGQSPSA